MNKKNLYIVAGSSGLVGHHVCAELEKYNKNFIGLDSKPGKYSQKIDLADQIAFLDKIKKNTDSDTSNISFVYAAGKNGTVEYGGLDKYGSFSEEDLNAYLYQNTILPYICSMSLINFLKNKKKQLKVLILCSHYSFVAGSDHLYNSRNEEINKIKPHGYIISKHAVIGVIRSLASTYGSDDVLINGFAPGGISNNQDKEFIEKFKKYAPLQRLANAEEIAKWICSISNPELTYANGAIFNIDGGVLIR